LTDCSVNEMVSGMPTIQLPAGAVAYDDIGHGPVVVLLHATLHDRSDYQHVAAALAATNRVIAIDWPGHGESPLPDDPASLSAVGLGDVLVQFVHALDLAGIVLVANSVGGYAACHLALTAPGRVAGLVIVQGSGFVPQTRVIRAFCKLQGHPGTIRALFRVQVPRYMSPRTDHDTQIVERVVDRSKTKPGAEVAAAIWRSFNDPRHDLRARAAQITAPTLVTWGVRDKNLKVEWGRAIHDTIPGSTWVEMDTGHLPFTSDLDGWLGIVGPFIADAHERNAATSPVNGSRSGKAEAEGS
jgi:pimeloyl-ACP methyl ester carboxylesterase